MHTQVCISLASRLTEMPTTIDVLLCLSKWPRELVLPIIEKKSEVKVVNIQNNKTTKQQIIKYVFKTKFQKRAATTERQRRVKGRGGRCGDRPRVRAKFCCVALLLFF